MRVSPKLTPRRADTAGMKYSWCVLAVTVLALTAACATGLRPTRLGLSADIPRQLRIKTADGAIRRIPLEQYVRAAIISEFAPAAGDPALVERMLEVQSIIARTYAVAHVSRHGRDGYDLCSTTHCQLYQPARLQSSSWASAANEAARHTAGMVLWYGSAPARTLFHADCGGHTSSDGAVWGGAAHPYLTAVADDGPAEAAHAAWRFEVERDALIAALNRDARTRVGRSLRDILVTQRDEGGRASLLVLRGAREPVVRGEELRLVLTRAFGAASVKSTRFEVEQYGGRFVFAGHGYGHGAGLCQVGALARLRAGTPPEQVLARYYPGTRLVVVR